MDESSQHFDTLIYGLTFLVKRIFRGRDKFCVRAHNHMGAHGRTQTRLVCCCLESMKYICFFSLGSVIVINFGCVAVLCVWLEKSEH